MSSYRTVTVVRECLPAEYALAVDDEIAAGEGHRIAGSGIVAITIGGHLMGKVNTWLEDSTGVAWATIFTASVLGDPL